jgi:hypothetical protein
MRAGERAIATDDTGQRRYRSLGRRERAIRNEAGEVADPGATNVRVRKAAGFDRATVECQPGERATGGGAHSVNGFIWASAPAANPSVIDTVAPLELQG